MPFFPQMVSQSAERDLSLESFGRRSAVLHVCLNLLFLPYCRAGLYRSVYDKGWRGRGEAFEDRIELFY